MAHPGRPLPGASWCPARSAGQLAGRPIKVARLATESGLFPVFEAEAGQVTSDGRVTDRITLDKPRRGRYHETRNVTDEGAGTRGGDGSAQCDGQVGTRQPRRYGSSDTRVIISAYLQR
jgi:hypothetical protein